MKKALLIKNTLALDPIEHYKNPSLVICTDGIFWDQGKLCTQYQGAAETATWEPEISIHNAYYWQFNFLAYQHLNDYVAYECTHSFINVSMMSFICIIHS